MKAGQINDALSQLAMLWKPAHKPQQSDIRVVFKDVIAQMTHYSEDLRQEQEGT